jgi:hypothetical protein
VTGTDILNLIGALSLLVYGVASLFLPRRVAAIISQGLTTAHGVAEFRVVHGGYFIGLAVFALLIRHPLVYAAVGVGWLGAAGARLFAWVADRPPLAPIYVAPLLFELAMGVMLLV